MPLVLIQDCNRPQLDVVAISDPDANAEKTWQLPDSTGSSKYSSIWSSLKARVYLYKYDPGDKTKDVETVIARAIIDLLQSITKSDIGVLPLHVAAHGTGGIVIARALDVQDPVPSEKQAYFAAPALLRRTYTSIAFFDVPDMSNSFFDIWGFLECTEESASLLDYKPNPRERGNKDRTKILMDFKINPESKSSSVDGSKACQKFTISSRQRERIGIEKNVHFPILEVYRYVVNADHYSITQLGEPAHSDLLQDYLDRVRENFVSLLVDYWNLPLVDFRMLAFVASDNRNGKRAYRWQSLCDLYEPTIPSSDPRSFYIQGSSIVTDLSPLNWINLPVNDLRLAELVIEKRIGEFNVLIDYLRTLQDRRRPAGVFMEPYCGLWTKKDVSHGKDRSPESLRKAPGSGSTAVLRLEKRRGVTEKVRQMLLLMPYLTIEAFDKVSTRHDWVKKKKHTCSRSDPCVEMDKESFVETEYLGKRLRADEKRAKYRGHVNRMNGTGLEKIEPHLHMRRTLAQYGHPAIQDTSVRDASQTVYSKEKFANLLMIDQLWCWMSTNGIVLTMSPVNRVCEPSGDWNIARPDLLTRVIDHHWTRLEGEPINLAAALTKEAVTQPFEHPWGEDIQLLRIYEDRVNLLVEGQEEAFNSFQTIYSEDDEPTPASLSIGNDLASLRDLRNIDDELVILTKLFSEQSQVVEKLIEIVGEEMHWGNFYPMHSRPPSEQLAYGFDCLEVTKRCLQKYLQQTEELRRICAETQEAYKTLLDMKQRQANIDEAASARLSAEQAAKQGRILMTFTIFTVVFLPLSFFTSVFGMNAREWTNEPTSPSLLLILPLLLCGSGAIVAIAMLIAFNKDVREFVQARGIAITDAFKDSRVEKGAKKVLGVVTGKRGRKGDVESQKEGKEKEKAS